jgi:integrase
MPKHYAVSSLHRQKGKPFWYCAYTDQEGRRHFKSTKATSRRDAERVCNAIQRSVDKARVGKLTEHNARKVIEDTVTEIIEAGGGTLQRFTVREYFEKWRDAHAMKESTRVRYTGVIAAFLRYLGPAAKNSLPSLQTKDIEAFIAHMSGKVASGTVKQYLKVIRAALNQAARTRLIDFNPAAPVENPHAGDRHKRRAFKLDELRKLLAVASDEWRTMTLVGLYTGLRMGDCAALTWANVDMQNRELTLEEQKTDSTHNLPVAKPLLRHLESLPASDDPRAPLCPSLFNLSTSALSNQFYELMASAGLVKSRGTHSAKKRGRGMRREQSVVTFHCLRHTATSLLKNAGVSDVVARDIIGHESESISRSYTHIEHATKLAAVDKLPDVLP